MKTLFNVALLAGLLAVTACGKKEEPVAAADNAGDATTTAAPATPDAGVPETGAAGTDAPAEMPADAAAETPDVTTETTASGAATTTTPASATSTAPAASAMTAVAGSTSAAASTTATSAAATAAKPPMTTAAPATAATPAASSATVAMNGDPGSMVRAEILRARPAADAPEAGSLAAGAKVKVLARDGGWYQVTGDGRTGWVRMLSVRRSESATTSVAGIAGIASGRTGTGKVVTTTGVRGLDSGDLSAATFDEARIAKAETLRVTRADAEAFARQAGLAPQTVAALPVPAK